jgi:dCTP deaminase
MERPSEGGFYSPFDKKAVDNYFSGAIKAEQHKIWAKKHGRGLFKNIPPNHSIIVLRPGERILGHTHEFIGIKAPGTSTLQARSTWGRNGVSVCLDAGWGDPGYINRWTMEIYNMNQHESVVLPVGERIAQMVFYETGPVAGEYKKLSGKYQSDTESKLDKIIKNWKPEDMLPRAYKDKRKHPIKIKGLKKYA